MNNPVMQRRMFMAIGTPSKKPEEGIVSGMESVEGYEDRTPDNLEIIANNLRGDIRSMDERYLELAGMVGEAAFDTPEEVLALMQSQLQQQGAPAAAAPPPPPAASPKMGGIEALGELGAFNYFQNPRPQWGLREALGSYVSVPSPGGIEGLVAPPTEQAPVMRQAGSPPTGEVSRNMRITLPPSAYPSYLEAMRSYGRAAPTSIPSGNMYTQSILDLLKTEAPTSRSGRPIPFVDRSGRMYQPVGGTDPRMASRGTPFLPRSAYGPQMLRMLGPLGYTAGAGYLGTKALMATDKSAGELTGDSFGLEFGSSVAGTPGYRYLPGVEPTPVPAPISQQPSGLAEKIPVAPSAPVPLPSRESDAADAVAIAPGVVPSAKDEEEEVTEAGVKGTLPAPPKPAERGLKERTEERYRIYRDLLGDDKNMRQAQALFLLAEAALNVGGAKSKQRGVSGTLERLTTGLKGLPAGLAALGAEASREDKALKAAAISAVEQEMAAEAKERGLTMREYLKQSGKINKADVEVQQLAAAFERRFPGQSPEIYLQLGQDWKNGIIEQNKDTGEIQDKATGKVLMSRVSPVREVVKDGKRVVEENDQLVGYLDPTIPYTVTSTKKFSPATNKQRPELIDRISNNESLVQDIENFYRTTTRNFIGIMPSIQSGVTNLTLPFFGENPFSNVPLQQQRNAALQMNQLLREMAMAYRGRPSNWSEQQVNKYLVDPEAIFKDKSQFFAVLENFRQGAINEINQDRHRLFPNEVPLRQMDRIPLGSKQDPIVITKADPEKGIKSTASYLGELFRVNPNREVYVKLPDGTTEKVTPELLRTLPGQQ